MYGAPSFYCPEYEVETHLIGVHWQCLHKRPDTSFIDIPWVERLENAILFTCRRRSKTGLKRA